MKKILILIILFSYCTEKPVDKELDAANNTAAVYLVKAQLMGLPYDNNLTTLGYAKAKFDSTKAYALLYAKSIKYLVKHGEAPTEEKIKQVIYSPSVELTTLESEKK